MQSVSNRALTLLRKLNQKKHREQEQLFLVEGPRAIGQIISNGYVKVRELFFDASQEYHEQEIWHQAISDTPASLVESSDFSEISDTDNPQGVLAVCEIPNEIPPNQMAAQSGLLLALDAVQDPGNAGTIIRTASWFGVSGLLSGKGTVDLFHPKVVRSTAGATGSVPFTNVDLHETLTFFEDKGWNVVLLDAGVEAVSMQEVKKKEKTIIVVGNEAHGVDASLTGNNRQKARIASPSARKNVESLNAAIATSIALYEFAGK